MKHVYIVRAGDSHYKIGVTSNIVKRISELQTSNGHKIELVSSRLVDDEKKVESELHKALREVRLSGGREWFDLTPKEAIDLCVELSKYSIPETSILESLKETLALQTEKSIKLMRKIDRCIGQPIKETHKVKLKVTRHSPKPIQKDDELAEQALSVFRTAGYASTSLLQRKLRIGYGRSARILDRLEQEGFVARQENNKPRELINVN